MQRFDQHIDQNDRQIYEERTKLYVKLNAIHKLGSFSIGCEHFSIPGSITNGGIGIGSSPIGYQGFMQPRKGQGASKTKLILQ